MSLGNLGMLRNWQGRHDEALHLQLEALRKLMASGHDGAVTYTLVNSAESLLPLQEAESAAVLLGARDSIHERLNVLDLSLTKKRRERVEEELRKALGDEGFEGALHRGRLLSPNGAAALLESKVPAGAR
jgi:hypothetical protein